MTRRNQHYSIAEIEENINRLEGRENFLRNSPFSPINFESLNYEDMWLESARREWLERTAENCSVSKYGRVKKIKKVLLLKN